MELSAVVVGAGFSGLAAGILMKKAGIESFVILEKAESVGGTWRENTYPGAACDVQSHLYSYSFEPNPAWSRTYGKQEEILAYLRHCAEKYRLGPHLRFGREVNGAEFDDATGTWTVRTRNGETYRARALVLGNGALHLPSFPNLPGQDSFAGRRFHSAQWDHGYDLAGKRVAVIGTGASSIQFVPQIAPTVAQLHLFQRTPPWVMPKDDRAMTRRELWALDRLPGAHWLRRTGLYWRMETRVIPFNYAPKIAALAERVGKQHIARQISDPALRARLTPDYRLGCKRVLISNDYYPALNRANVEVVTDGIAGIEPTGVRTADGTLREVDAIIYGTGFRVADYLAPVHIVGRGGAVLNDVWRVSPRSYLGINVAGFPNLFLLMGPNTGLGHNSMIFMIEAQARYAVSSIQTMRRRGLASMDVRPAVQDAFRQELARKLKDTVWTSGCHAWYQTPDGEVLLWPGFSFDYWRRTRRVDLSQYELRSAA
jgi:cation diffusion facilitator CzcD-associated flavoprotein CzcO